MSKKKIALIVGGNSQDGRYLSSFLLKKNYCIHVIFNKNKQKIDKRIKIIKFNINDRTKFEIYCKKLSNLEIYYFPSINVDSTKNENKKIFEKNIDLNFVKLNQLLEIVSKLHNKKKIKIFYSCSSHIFKGNKAKGKKSEKSDYITNSYYGFSKLCGLRLCEFYRNKYNLFISVGILFPHFSKFSNSNFLIPKIYNQLKKNQVINIHNVNSKIDFLHTKQVIKLIYKVMKLKKPNTFIISSGKKVEIRRICEILGKLMSKKVKIKSTIKKKERLNDLAGNINKIKKFINISKNELSITKNLSDFINE